MANSNVGRTPSERSPGIVPGDLTTGWSRRREVTHRPRRVGWFVVTALALLVADATTKIVVVETLSNRPPIRLAGGMVYLTEARNTGAAFSFAQGATLFLTLIAVVVAIVIARTAARLRSVPWAVSLGLILGGALGNLVDRVLRAPAPMRGAVVDWISVFDPHGGVWPIFNLADAGIVVGGIVALSLSLLGYEFDGRRISRRRIRR